MKKTVSIFLILALALSLLACAKAPTPTEAPSNTLTFTFKVVNGDSVTQQQVTTTQAYAGAALLEQKLIEGDQGDYGLYVMSVLGQRVTYEEHGAWWSLYINGESSMVGVDSVTLEEGMLVEFRVEKA